MVAEIEDKVDWIKCKEITKISTVPLSSVVVEVQRRSRGTKSTFTRGSFVVYILASQRKLSRLRPVAGECTQNQSSACYATSAFACAYEYYC